MNSPRPPAAPESGESEPDTVASVPDIALWSESDLDVPPGPAASFAKSPPAATDDTLPTVGHIGRYALKYRIGEGGLGTVYAAHDPLLSRLIAIKTLNLEISNEERESFNALFLNEARAAAGLSHPNIVTVFDAGVSDNSAYIAMELLKGRDLRQLRQEGWRPAPAEAALIVRRVADALAYAHSKGVVHCDIKPANIFMVGRTQPRVLDFGIARIAHQHEAGNSGGLAAGSPYYMAPEQVRHQTVDRRSDVFSLGVVFYELLTDVKPFRGTSLSEITDAVLDHQPPLASEVDPAVPQELAEIAARAMQKDPEHRFRSSRAFSRELRHWLEEHSISSEATGVGSPARNSARRLRAATLVAALAVAVVGLWAWLSPRHVAVPESTAAPVANVVAAAASVASAAPVQAPAGSEEVDVVAPTPPAAAVRTAPAAKPSIPEKATRASVASLKESPKDKRAREAREREAKAPTAPTAPVATGVVRIAISPWGHVDVDGAPAGTTPPLNELTLAEGKHQIVVRNEDFPPYSATVTVSPGQVVTLKYKFGS